MFVPRDNLLIRKFHKLKDTETMSSLILITIGILKLKFNETLFCYLQNSRVKGQLFDFHNISQVIPLKTMN